MNLGIRKNPNIKYLAICLICLGLALGIVIHAKAHAILIRTDPADNSILEEPPKQVRLWFSEAISPQLSSARVIDLDGNPIPTNAIRIDQSDPTLMVLDLPRLDRGVYTVNWNAISAVDGHAVKGYFVFSVAVDTIPAGNTQDKLEPGLQRTILPEIVLRWLNYSSLMVLTGCSGILLFVLRPFPAPGDQRLATGSSYQFARTRILELGLFTAEFIFLIGPAQVIWQVASLMNTVQGNFSVFQVARQVMLGTLWGYAWLAREALLAILVIQFIRLVIADNPKRSDFLLTMAVILGALAAQSMASHAAGGKDSALPVLVDFLHLVFAGLWIGGLIALVVSLLPVLLQDKANFKELVRISWGPFSRVAIISVGVVVGTGIFSTGRQVISADALLLSPYGKILSTKVALVLVAGLFGLTNSVLLHPNLVAPFARWLRKPAGWAPVRADWFPWLVVAEMVLGLFIVLLAGALTSLPPAKNVAYTITPGGQPDRVFQPADDLIVALSIKPNQPGANLFFVEVSNTRQPPPGEILRVIAVLTYLDLDIGITRQDAEFVEKKTGIYTYRMGGSHLTQPGRWKIEILVRRKGLPDSQAVFNWTVMPLGEIPPVVLSRFPWRNTLAMVAGLIAAIVIIPTGLSLLKQTMNPDHQEQSDK